jgi:hypothetical protein
MAEPRRRSREGGDDLPRATRALDDTSGYDHVEDTVNGRQTASSLAGKPQPILFGRSTTELLMFIALNPGASCQRTRKAINIGGFQNFHYLTKRLRRINVLSVGAGRFYQINRGLKQYREFVALLRAMGLAAGLSGPRSSGWLKRGSTKRAQSITATLPPVLFRSKQLHRILLLVATLNETYGLEAGSVLDIHHNHVMASLRNLHAEGVLKMRTVKSSKCYSINLENGYGQELLTLLRHTASNDKYIINCANNAFARRLEVERSGTVRERHMFANLAAAWGVQNAIHQVERKKKPRSRWRRLHGRFNGRSWWLSRGKRGVYRLSDMQRSAFRVPTVTRSKKAA